MDTPAKTYIHQLYADIRCYQEGWPIGVDGETDSKEYVLSARLDDNENFKSRMEFDLVCVSISYNDPILIST